ncbi:MAG TPA: glycosyltransferase family 1 protein, partial [Coriobacteriia bacterium]|nr:glycosyltransferase family 1 protein [Coriobacteriia bacterium]
MTLDTLADRMAGPAIRAWEIARALSAQHDVRLVTFGRCTREGDGFAARQVAVGDFRGAVEASDIVIIQGFVFNAFPWLQTCPQILVVDLYDPFQLETLEVDRYKPEAQRHQALAFALGELSDQMRRGDFFLCASRRQRDLWIGHLAAAGRVNPDTYDADPTLRSLIAVVPFGTPNEPPVQHRHGIKGATPGIGPEDKVVLWGGGVYNWFDPLTLVRAIDVLRSTVPQVRLYFLGMRHPNPDVPEMALATRCRELSDQLGLTGTHVFFNEEWVAYETRADYLLDADVGVSCHYPHVETEFAFRTRILDY